LKKIGVVSHYFDKIRVAIVELKAPLAVGDKVCIRGGTTDFQQTVKSMQIEHEAVQRAKKGQSIGLKVTKRAREGNTVYKLD
jgi:putative protease